jgi:F-type H+-transporting ATPase subunit gamma
MELIAASRIAKAQHAIAAARPYVNAMSELLVGLARNYEARRHAIFSESESIEGVAVVVVSADRGLCGAYNSNILRTAERLIKDHQEAGRVCKVVAIGKKAQGYFRYRGYEIDKSFLGMTDQPKFTDASLVGKQVSELMLQPEINLVQIVYTQFISLGTQKVVTEQIYPVVADGLLQGPTADSANGPELDGAGGGTSAGTGAGAGGGLSAASPLMYIDYEFEPDSDILIDNLVPRVLETRIFGSLLDASASEHASRQRAMKAATDNADEFAKNLTRQMNRARQDSITTEIMEIIGGAEALG